MRFFAAAAMLMALILLPGPMAAVASRAVGDLRAFVGKTIPLAKTIPSSGATTAQPHKNAAVLAVASGRAGGGVVNKSNQLRLLSRQPVMQAGFVFGAPQLTTDIVGLVEQSAAWLRATYHRRPIAAISFIVLILLPLLALPSLFLLWWQRWRRSRALADGQDSNQCQRLVVPSVLGPAWIAIEGGKFGGSNDRIMPISGEMLRIGRESDNDICLRDRSVHRYHALIHRSPDAEYFITDLSGDGGNGVWVNGVKQRAVELCSGDLIQLGSADVRFVRGRASQ